MRHIRSNSRILLGPEERSILDLSAQILGQFGRAVTAFVYGVLIIKSGLIGGDFALLSSATHVDVGGAGRKFRSCCGRGVDGDEKGFLGNSKSG